MAASQRRDLFINIGGSASELSTAAKAGRSALLELSQSTGSIVDQITANMQKIGASATAPLAELDRNFKTSLGNIRAELRSLQASGDSSAALKFFDANSIGQQVAQGERLTVQYRQIAEAAQQVAATGGSNSEAAKVWAASYGTLAAQTELETEKLRGLSRAQQEVLGKIDGQVEGGKRVTASSGQQRAAMQQLSFQLNDIAGGFAAGTKPAVIFAQQSSQVVQALQLMVTSGEGWLGTVAKFAPFVGAALVVLTPFIAKLFENNDALQQGVDKLKKSAAETDAARLATTAYSRTLEGEIELQRKLNDELDRSIRTQRQINQNKLRDVQANVADLQTTKRPDLVAKIAEQERAVAQLRSTPLGNDPSGQALAALAEAQAKLAELKARLAAADQAIAAGLRGIREAQIPLIQNDVESQLDANAAAARRYEIALGNLNQQLAIGAGNKAKKQFYLPDGTFDTREVSGISAAEYQRQLVIIAARKKAEEKAASDAKKEQPAGSPSTALLSSAESYRGASERGSGRSTLDALFKSAGITIDPEMTAWCAAFVNAVLATNGLKGTSSNAARSFLNYGAKTDAPQKGDIVVLKRDGGGAGSGHVGFFEGFDKAGNVKVLGGNQGDKVGVSTFNRADVLGYRRAPASAQSAEDTAAKAAQKESERRAAFERELGDEQAKVLSLSRELTVADDDRLDVKLATIAAEKENRDKALTNLVTNGKLTKAEADQLKGINARIADEKAAIATNKAILDNRRKILEIDRAEYEDKSALLNLQGELATTNKERLRIAREMLDLEFAQRRKATEAKLASHDPDEAADGKRELARIGTEEPLRRAATDKQYAGPLDQFRTQLHAATDDMDEALQGVAVHGLQNLEDGLLGIIDGTESVGSAFKKMAASILADLARIAIEKAFVKLLSFSDGNVPGFSHGTVPGFASGVISGPGTGTSDSIPGWMAGVGLIRVSNGEGIMTARAVRDYGPVLKAMNDNVLPRFADGSLPSFPSLPSSASLGGGSGHVIQNISYDLRGAMVDRDVMAEARAYTDQRAAQAFNASVDHTNGTLRDLRRNRL